MSGWRLFFFLLFLLLLFGFLGWVVYTQLRARRQGLSPPSWRSYVPFIRGGMFRGGNFGGSATNYPTPRHAGPIEWIRDQIAKMQNKRTARGAYEGTAGGDGGGYSGLGGGGRRGRGGGLEDDAWDTRVGNEDPYGPGSGYGYEEQELGLTPTPGLQSEPYGGGSDYMSRGGGAGGVPMYGDERGRTGQNSRGLAPENPFGDQNEAASLRSVSPRPVVDTSGRSHNKGANSLDSTGTGDGGSPTSTRKSVFREGI